MKTKINVIDFDGTLINYDSFKKLILNELKKFNLIIFFYSILRILRLINLKKYKELVSKRIIKKYKPEFFHGFSNVLYSDINSEILKIIQEKTDVNTINVLISASPDFYIRHIIKKLNWEGSGSYFDEDNNFIHLHGCEKIKWLKRNYNVNKYKYYFAISDSKSDIELLSLFKNKILWTSH